MHPYWWRVWHDERLCGGVLPLQVEFDPLMCMGVLTCICGFVCHFTIEEAANGRPMTCCATCGHRGFEGECFTCRWMAGKLGTIVSVSHDRRLF